MIQMNEFARQWAEIESSVLQAVQRVGSSGWYVLGHEVQAFEKALVEMWGMEEAVGCGNGLDAIEIGLRVLGIQPGDSVLTTPLSAFATTLAIIRAGGVPVFCDVDECGLMDLDAVDRYLEEHPETRYLVPVHLYGKCLNLERLRAIKAKHSLHVIEDCAQSVGAKYEQHPCGSVGDVSAVSFYPTKNLGGIGDGGAMLTNRRELADAAQSIRNYGQGAQYDHQRIGLNSRLDELQAAILHDGMLPRLEAWTGRRREIAQRYTEEISSSRINILPNDTSSSSVWHLFPVRIPTSREHFMRDLKTKGIGTGIHYPTLIPAQPACADYFSGDSAVQFPMATAITREEVSLPIHPFLRDDEVDRVIQACNEWEG